MVWQENWFEKEITSSQKLPKDKQERYGLQQLVAENRD